MIDINLGGKMPVTIQIEIPDSISKHYKNRDEITKSAFEDIVIREFQKGNISIREGAKILDLTYEGFMEFLGEKRISFINVTPEEQKKDYDRRQIS
jgi:predicted HTH domain antitoxin